MAEEPQSNQLRNSLDSESLEKELSDRLTEIFGVGIGKFNCVISFAFSFFVECS
jgi:hypothetical protein